MDPDLRAAWEALNAKMDTIATDLRANMGAMEQRAVARDAATRAVAEAAVQMATAARQEATDARQDAHVMHEATMAAIKALGEGLTKHQSEQIERQAAEQQHALMDQHILPLEASAADHEHRITTLEQRTR